MVHRMDMREHMIALLCKPREIESRPQIVALQALGSTVASITGTCYFSDGCSPQSQENLYPGERPSSCGGCIVVDSG